MKIIRKFILSAIAIALTLTSFNTLAAENTFNEAQTQEIQKIIRNYLITNPDVLIEASNSLRAKEQQKAKAKALTAISKNTKTIFNSNSPSFGNNDGELVIVEFLDYQCGHCKKMSAIVKEISDENKKVKVIIKELPIFGKTSNFAARAAVASNKQGTDKYLSFHQELLKENSPLNEDKVFEIAKKAGVNVEKLKADMDADDVKEQIQENFKLAQEIGLLGTPAFIVANKTGSKTEYIPGATSKETLTQALNKVSTKQS